MNALCDANPSIETVIKRVNGVLNGLGAQVKHYNCYLKVSV